MKLKSGIVVWICLIVFLCHHAEAQSGRMRAKTDAPKDNDDVLRLRAEEVLLPVSVRSFVGKLPSSLGPNDFIVAEDDHRQHITAVQRTPANILFILDTSGDLPLVKTINQNREIALKIIQELGSNDKAAIITYSDKVELISSWTGDKDELRQAIDWKFRPGLKARLYESLRFAAEDVLPKVNGRRSVVLITDGVDSFDSLAVQQALSALHHARATVYIVNIGAIIFEEIKPRAYNPLSWYEMIDPRKRELILKLRAYASRMKAGEPALDRLVEETGGAMWKPPTRDELIRINYRVLEEIGTEYVIAYSSDRKLNDKEFHLVRVFTTSRDLIVRARRGVYANLPEK